MIRYWWLALSLVTASTQVSITKFEVPQAVVVGQNVELRCEFELGSSDPPLQYSYVKWLWSPATAPDEKRLIYQRFGDKPPQKTLGNINMKEGNTIELVDVNPIDAGVYECEVYDVDEDRRHQEIFVYTKGSGPAMNVSLVEDGPDEDTEQDVRVSCQATGVAPEPDLGITVNGKNVSQDMRIEMYPSEGLYDIYAEVLLSKDLMEGALIRCELFFKNTNIAHEVFATERTYRAAGAAPVPPEVVATEATSGEMAPENLLRDGSAAVNGAWLALLVHLLVLCTV